MEGENVSLHVMCLRYALYEMRTMFLYRSAIEHTAQVGAFGDPGRDPRGWQISAAYAALVPSTEMGVKAAVCQIAHVYTEAPTSNFGLLSSHKSEHDKLHLPAEGQLKGKLKTRQHN